MPDHSLHDCRYTNVVGLVKELAVSRINRSARRPPSSDFIASPIHRMILYAWQLVVVKPRVAWVVTCMPIAGGRPRGSRHASGPAGLVGAGLIAGAPQPRRHLQFIRYASVDTPESTADI
jgi:hypothetical protein